MTNEQINAAIVEAINADPHWKCAKDYCNDLNAMHEAEKTLKTEHRKRYIHHLEGWDRNLGYEWDIATATARQRAEAFLRTIGKWEEGE